MAPHGDYSPAALAWYDNLPIGTHVRWLGFDYDHQIYIEGNGARSLVAYGWQLSLTMPFWAMWLAWVFVLLMTLFCAANQYSRLQWQTGIRYLVPTVPWLLLLAIPVLRRMPRVFRAVIVAATLSSSELAAAGTSSESPV